MIVSTLAILISIGVIVLGVRLFENLNWTRLNWRSRPVPFPAGALIVVSAAISITIFAISSGIDELKADGPQTLGLASILILTFGVALLGLVDDLVDATPRGLRGHGKALLSGQVSTGIIKAVGTLILSLAVVRPDSFKGMLTVVVLVLATNLFNLFDLRPGRAFKYFLIVIAVIVIGYGVAPIRHIGLMFFIPICVVGLYDLRERVMLGDTGSNMLGVLCGICLVEVLSTTGLFIASVALAGLTVYGELFSFSKTIERISFLRWFDRFGRPQDRGTDRPRRSTA